MSFIIQKFYQWFVLLPSVKKNCPSFGGPWPPVPPWIRHCPGAPLPRAGTELRSPDAVVFGTVQHNLELVYNVIRKWWSYRFLKPSDSQRPAAAFKMVLVAHALSLKQLLKSVFYYSVDQWRNSGVTASPQGLQLREDPGGKRPESGPFSSHIAQDGDWGPIF